MQVEKNNRYAAEVIWGQEQFYLIFYNCMYPANGIAIFFFVASDSSLKGKIISSAAEACWA